MYIRPSLQISKKRPHAASDENQAARHHISKIPKLSPTINIGRSDSMPSLKRTPERLPMTNVNHQRVSPLVTRSRPFKKSPEIQSSFGRSTPPASPRRTVKTMTPIIVTSTPTRAPVAPSRRPSLPAPCMNCRCCEYIKAIQPLVTEAYQRQKRISSLLSNRERFSLDG